MIFSTENILLADLSEVKASYCDTDEIHIVFYNGSLIHIKYFDRDTLSSDFTKLKLELKKRNDENDEN